MVPTSMARVSVAQYLANGTAPFALNFALLIREWRGRAVERKRIRTALRIIAGPQRQYPVPLSAFSTTQNFIICRLINRPSMGLQPLPLPLFPFVVIADKVDEFRGSQLPIGRPFRHGGEISIAKRL